MPKEKPPIVIPLYDFKSNQTGEPAELSYERPVNPGERNVLGGPLVGNKTITEVVKYGYEHNYLLGQTIESYQPVTKDTVQVKTTEFVVDPNANRFWNVTITFKTIPASSEPFNWVEKRKLEVYAEKIIGGTGVSVEVSDGNIVDWENAENIVEEIAWQFENNGVRRTTVSLDGEVYVDTGWGVSSGSLVNTASKIGARSLGSRAKVSSYTRSKSSSGSATTEIIVEGEL